MPDKFVFPGGRVDETDEGIPFGGELNPTCRDRLREWNGPAPETLAAAAIRELWEETGQLLACPGDWPNPPRPWSTFARAGLRPDPVPLHFTFRAITPPGPPRRFDARFFIADAAYLFGDPDDFNHASDELRGLSWLPLAVARALDLPFITRLVLDHAALMLPDIRAPDRVPFFRDGDEERARARMEQGYTT